MPDQDYKATGIINNEANVNLTLVSSNITSGSWTSPPVAVINANTTSNPAFVAEGGSGTSGSIAYKSTAGNFTLKWFNNPADGPNSIETDTTGDLGAMGDQQPRTGKVAVFTYLVNNA